MSGSRIYKYFLTRIFPFYLIDVLILAATGRWFPAPGNCPLESYPHFALEAFYLIVIGPLGGAGSHGACYATICGDSRVAFVLILASFFLAIATFVKRNADIAPRLLDLTVLCWQVPATLAVLNDVNVIACYS